jgi:hypothetical protein
MREEGVSDSAARADRRQLPDQAVAPERSKDWDARGGVSDNYRDSAARADRRQLPDQAVVPGGERPGIRREEIHGDDRQE